MDRKRQEAVAKRQEQQQEKRKQLTVKGRVISKVPPQVFLGGNEI
jgi:hypothetical protein